MLAYQGIGDPDRAPARIREMAEHAVRLLADLAAPAGISCDISTAEFAAVYEGEGHNEPVTPVGEIHGRADAMVLFAITGELESR